MQSPFERYGLTGRPDVRWTAPAEPVQALVLMDWTDHAGRVGTTVAQLGADGELYGCRDVPAGGNHDTIVAAWRQPAESDGLAIDDRRACEPVHLVDGPADQVLIPGVAPVPLAARQIAQEQRRRAARRGDAPLPSGGLFDDVARQQQELFT